MGRRSGGYKHCAFRRWSADQYPFADDPAKGMADTWCGEKRLHDRAKPFESPRLATCPKCAQAIGKAKLAKLPRLRLEKRAEPVNGYQRSSYDVLIDGELRGYVSCDTGWGTHWSLYRLKGPSESWSSYENGPCVSGKRVDQFDARHWLNGGHTNPESVTFWPVHYAAKEAMAVAALAAFERGSLPTYAEQEAEIAERKERERLDALERQAAREERDKERARLEDIRLERVATWREALASLDARADLSNLERAGLEAIKLLYPID